MKIKFGTKDAYAGTPLWCRFWGIIFWGNNGQAHSIGYQITGINEPKAESTGE